VVTHSNTRSALSVASALGFWGDGSLCLSLSISNALPVSIWFAVRAEIGEGQFGFRTHASAIPTTVWSTGPLRLDGLDPLMAPAKICLRSEVTCLSRSDQDSIPRIHVEVAMDVRFSAFWSSDRGSYEPTMPNPKLIEFTIPSGTNEAIASKGSP